MTDLSDHFQTAGVMAHMLRTLPDTYEDDCTALLARFEGEPQAQVRAYLEAGVTPVVIEALVEIKIEPTLERLEWVLSTQKKYGASALAMFLSAARPEKLLPDITAKARQTGMTRLFQRNLERSLEAQFKAPTVTIAERRAKRRERRGR